MVQINFAQKQVNAKIVFYGPGMSGKTTNLEIIHQRAPTPNKGELTSISTDGDRTLFFDFMPLDLGTVAGMRTCFQIYTVPGQVYYNSTRKLVLQGVDGVVFVADSSAAMIEENLESMKNLEQNLAEYGKSLTSVPIVIQYNKRDMPDAMSVAELDAVLNPHGFPTFEAIAANGQGVFPTLKGLAAKVLESIHGNARGSGAPTSTASAPAAAVPSPAPTPAPTPAPAAPVAGLSQTGFRPRTLSQTGFRQRPAAPTNAPTAPAAPAAAGASGGLGMGALPSIPSAPTAPSAPAAIPMRPAAAAQASQAPAGLPPAPSFQAPPTAAIPAPPTAAPAAAPAVKTNTATATISMASAHPHPAPAQRASGAPMASARGPAPAAPAPRPAPVARTRTLPTAAPAPAPAVEPASLQRPLPPSRSRQWMLIGGFVVATLVVGALLAKFVFPKL